MSNDRELKDRYAAGCAAAKAGEDFHAAGLRAAVDASLAKCREAKLEWAQEAQRFVQERDAARAEAREHMRAKNQALQELAAALRDAEKAHEAMKAERDEQRHRADVNDAHWQRTLDELSDVRRRLCETKENLGEVTTRSAVFRHDAQSAGAKRIGAEIREKKAEERAERAEAEAGRLRRQRDALCESLRRFAEHLAASGRADQAEAVKAALGAVLGIEALAGGEAEGRGGA